MGIVVYRCHALMARGQYFEAEQIIDKLPDSGDYSARLIKAEICLNKGNYEEGHKILDALYNEEQDIDMILDIAQIDLKIALDEFDGALHFIRGQRRAISLRDHELAHKNGLLSEKYAKIIV